MNPVRHPIGIALADERPLAGRIVGWMFVVGAVVTTLLPLLPGSRNAILTPTLAIAVAALAWGVVALTRIDWTSAPGWVIHVATILGALAAAVSTSDAGGAGSPTRFLLMLVLVYAAYFFPAREAWPYLGLVLGLHALPFAYDPHAVSEGLLGELLVVTPCYWLLTFLLVTGKRGMVTQRARADDLARRDPLTGLANRRALMEALPGRLDGRRAEDRLGLLALDVDDFKLVNTVHGHPGGDRALVYIATLLRDAARGHDLVARLGGDEFAVLVRHASVGAMEALSARVLARARRSEETLGFRVRVSAGWALDEPDAEALLAAADAALGFAKDRGKDRVLGAV